MSAFFKRTGLALALTVPIGWSLLAQPQPVLDPGELSEAPAAEAAAPQDEVLVDQAPVEQAKTLIKQKKVDDAMNVLNSSAERNTGNADWFATHGSIYLSKQQFKEAEKDLDKALEIDPKHAYAHYYMGLTQSGLKRTDQMVKHFELFLELAPKAPEASRVKSLLRSI